VCEQAREDAFQLMLAHAGELGANAVIGMRYDATVARPGHHGSIVLRDGGFVEGAS